MRHEQRAVRSLANGGFRVLDRLRVLHAFDRSLPGRVTVLMYHGILRTGPSRIGSPAMDRNSFARQVAYLKRHFSIVHPNEIGDGVAAGDTVGPRRVALTFDDGFGNNATQAMPILEEMKAPALFFVSTRHIVPGQYLWFMHALALFMLYPGTCVELMQRHWKLDSQKHRQRLFWEFVGLSRKFTVQQIHAELDRYPVESFVPPEVIEDEMRGMTAAEARATAANPQFVIGAHTRDHPLLTTCSDEDLDSQIRDGKEDIERICGKSPFDFAYPEGEHNTRVIEKIRQAGFRIAFGSGVAPQSPPDPFAVPRIGVYSGGLGILAAKVHEWIRG